MTGLVVCLSFLICFCVVNVESANGDANITDVPKEAQCSVETSVRFDSGIKENSTCGYVEGRVQICEDGGWKNLCDSNWTILDAQVTCRALNYSAIGESSCRDNKCLAIYRLPIDDNYRIFMNQS